jgi:hypothetical protein
MGKTKLQNHKPEEYHLGIIRSLKKENAQLRKRIKQLEALNNIQGTENPIKKPKKGKKPSIVEESEGNCPGCGKSDLNEIEFAGRIFEVCELCFYRQKKVMKKRK